MNIIYDHQIFSRQKYGGISRYFHEIASRIASLERNNVEVFAPLYVNHYHNESRKIRPNGFRVRKFPGAALALGLPNLAIGAFYVRSRKDIEVFHETYYSTVSYAPKTAKRIITVYDMIHELYPESFSRFDMTRRVKRRAVRRADHVICISESTRRDLMRLMDVPLEKTSVVYLGHSLTATHCGETVSAAFNKPYLLYVGKRSGYKNFKCLLYAYAQSVQLRKEIDLVCFGGGKLTHGELSTMKRLDLSPDSVICVTGDDQLLAGLYASAVALIYPSIYEGFGMPPLEAMAHGCPVISSNTSSLPEVVGEAAALFDPEDVDSLRKAIERVLDSTDTASHLIALGYERIKKFSWDKCARETLGQYKALLGR